MGVVSQNESINLAQSVQCEPSVPGRAALCGHFRTSLCKKSSFCLLFLNMSGFCSFATPKNTCPRVEGNCSLGPCPLYRCHMSRVNGWEMLKKAKKAKIDKPHVHMWNAQKQVLPVCAKSLQMVVVRYRHPEPAVPCPLPLPPCPPPHVVPLPPCPPCSVSM